MTRALGIDPGKATGIALGFYDAITPFSLLERWQVKGGVTGFIRWAIDVLPTLDVDEIVVEKFILDGDNEFTADLTPVEIEGAIAVLQALGQWPPVTVTWQLRTAKGSLTGYPPTAKTKAQRQRVRFDFLARFDLFRAGTDNDDSNDAITHLLVFLKRKLHYPSMMVFWPVTRHLTLVEDKAAA